MKKEDFIALGLEEKAAEKAAEAFLQALRGCVPKARLDEVIAARRAAEEKAALCQEEMRSLKEAGDAKELKEQIAALESEMRLREETHAAELMRMRIDADVEAALFEAKAKNHRAARALLDLEAAQLDADGRVKGLREQIAALTKAEDSRFMFGAAAQRIRGARTGENGVEEADRAAGTEAMSYEELCAYLSENPGALSGALSGV